MSGSALFAFGDAPRPALRESSAIGDAVAGLSAARAAWRARQEESRDVDSFPSRAVLEQVVAQLAAAIYPRRLGLFRGPVAEIDRFVAAKLIAALGALEREIANELAYWEPETRARFEPDQAPMIARLFASNLGEVRRLVDSDVEAAFLADPAARSVDEVLVCYPGAIASIHHRVAHQLHALGAPIVARIISEIANERTGIDIHPGATIGPSFFIDHGTGVVIGETAIVGARVRLHQHVTLGALALPGDGRIDVRERHARHPIVGDDVVIHAGATILGRVTIGARARIGGNVWLLEDVLPDGAVVQSPMNRLGSDATPGWPAAASGA